MADVNRRMVRVLKGFSELTYEERSEVFRQIKEFQDNIDVPVRNRIVENFSKKAGVDLGPTNSGGCPCCGR